jgi:hypothetical protein
MKRIDIIKENNRLAIEHNERGTRRTAQVETEYSTYAVSSRVRSLLAIENIKQATLSRILGTSLVTANKKVNGKADFKASELYAIAKRFGVTTDWLLFGEDG